MIRIEFPNDWKDYELIDSGNGAKLERFSRYLVARPDPRALWEPALSEKEWDRADAKFIRTGPDAGDWHIKTKPPTNWKLTYNELIFLLKPTSFKHVGVFPEQAANWNWIQAQLTNKRDASVLNLFAYTGGATLAAAKAGAKVTHVDAVKSVITWARENLEASGLGSAPVRWMEDDALKFVLRDQRRGVRYDGIIMDPPRFGHGAKGEIWKLEDHLAKIVKAAAEILTERPSFFLLNAYTADLSPLVLHHLLNDNLKRLGGNIECGELVLQESASKRFLPNGIFARWSANT